MILSSQKKSSRECARAPAQLAELAEIFGSAESWTIRESNGISNQTRRAPKKSKNARVHRLYRTEAHYLFIFDIS